MGRGAILHIHFGLCNKNRNYRKNSSLSNELRISRKKSLMTDLADEKI